MNEQADTYVELPLHEAERMLRLCRAANINWPGPSDPRDHYEGFRLFVNAPVMAKLSEEFPEAAHMFRTYPEAP